MLSGIRSQVTGFIKNISWRSSTETVQPISAPTEYEGADRRLARYAVLSAYWESSQYDSTINAWAGIRKTQKGLYKAIRPIFNVTARLISFYHIHLLGGALDPDAGDGNPTESSIPILDASDGIRKSISRLWRDSNWQVHKDTLSLWGALYGDVAIKIVDDPAREQVYLEVIPPYHIADLVVDKRGFVQGYTLMEEVPDPVDPSSTVMYVEIAFRTETEGGNSAIQYETYLDSTPYAWNGVDSVWLEEGFDFIPFVAIQHINIGSKWGMAEFFLTLAKMDEASDQSSVLGDAQRKNHNPFWLMAGLTSRVGAANKTATTPARTTDNPNPIREVSMFIETPEAGASATPLVSNVDMEASSKHIADLRSDIDKDHPEIALDPNDEAAVAQSGRALRVIRQKPRSRVKARRVGYDAAMKRAIQMALTIGGINGYEGYEGITLESFNAGDLDFKIGPRPVFAPDAEDQLEIDRLTWEVALIANQAGMPVDKYLELQGYDEELVKAIKDRIDDADAQAAQLQASALLRGATQGASVIGSVLRRQEEPIEEPTI